MDKNEFIDKWKTALSSYGTPEDFTSSTYSEKRFFEVRGREYPLICVISKNNEQRRELMKLQQPYIPQKNKEDYNLRLDLEGCFLCQNVVQVIDSKNFPEKIKSNVIIDLGKNLITPNRYPSQIGHSLIIPINHDDTSKRIQPYLDETGKKVYLPEKGKTRGAIITPDLLEEYFEIFDKYSFGAFRNHVLDSMSIPGHDHWHLNPEDSPNFSLLEQFVVNAEKTNFGKNIFFAGNTPFDTLLIKGNNKEIAPIAANILLNMEKANEIFTLIYYNNNFFISPRNSEYFENTFHQLGAGGAIHFFYKEDGSDVETAKKLMPLKGEFNWGKFIG